MSSSELDATKIDFWPPRNPSSPFDWKVPTNEAYDVHQHNTFSAAFEKARSKLDYSYHKNPKMDRQTFQDTVLSRVIEAVTQKMKQTEGRPWIVFTAGKRLFCPKSSSESSPTILFSIKTNSFNVLFLLYSFTGPMGVGKSYVLSHLFKRDLFPLDGFIKIDPDMLKSELPEMAGYLKVNPETAATKLHRESTQMSDVLFEHSLLSKHNILVDGSLRDVEWYTFLFERLRKEFPDYQLAILYVSATPQTIKDRAKKRAERTGRAVPEELLQESIDQVPKSVAALSPLTDVTFEISNNDGKAMELKQLGDSVPTWDDFAKTWKPQEEEKSSNEQQESSEHPAMICEMTASYDDPEAHATANEIWKKSYPTFCARCALACDGQCGLCIHEIHMCSCKICNGLATECMRRS
jgi:hypothetical protein